MGKKTETIIPKDRISIVVSREDKKHLGFIALERDLATPGEAVSYILNYFDRTGKLKKVREPEPVPVRGSEPQGIEML